MIELIKKSGLFLLLALFLAHTLPAQQPPVQEGKIRYLLVHNWSKRLESLDYISKQRKERNAYMWGGSRSEWKEYANLYFNATQTRYEESEEKAEDDDFNYSWRKEAYTIRRDYATGMQHDLIQFLGKVYIVEDSIARQNWKILNDVKEVAGHVCMNAFWVDSLKNQRITVWFALDIPVNGGPERLCGLPGLILEVDVNDGALSIVADKIETIPVAEQLEMPKKLKGKRIKEVDYQKLIKDQIEEKRKNEDPWYWGIRYL